MNQDERRPGLRFFALLFPETKSGYSIDYYPKERADYERYYRKRIIGDFATLEEANAAIMAELERRFSRAGKTGRR